jgi:hypothetical protein
MFEKLLKDCTQFQAMAGALTEADIRKLLLDDASSRGEEADEGYASQLARDIVEEGKKLKAPKIADKQDLATLLERAASAITKKDVVRFNTTMDNIKSMAQQFAPEKFDPEFADFMLDEGVWNWLEEFKSRQTISDADLYPLKIIRDNLLFLAARMKGR